MPTVTAALGGRVPLVNLDQGSTVPPGFILHLADELTPADITDGFRQRVVLDHIFDVQALHTYDLVLAYELGRELVVIVTPSIRYLGVDCGHLLPCFGSILTHLFLLGELALSTSQFLLITGSKIGVAIAMTFSGDDHRIQ